jgi:RNA polymerase sigma-70 factor (ECF subfamily)
VNEYLYGMSSGTQHPTSQTVSDADQSAQVSLSSREDAALIERAAGGDEQAFRLIVEKYSRALRFHITRMVRDKEIIDDLIQEIFLKAFSNLGSYNTSFAFSTWLYRIATNHTIDHLRKKKLKTLSIDEPVQSKDGEMQIEIADNSTRADELILNKQRDKIILDALETLPSKYRMVIEMRHMEEKSYQEISEELDLPLGTVKAHIFRARELLYKYLKDKRSSF